MQGKNIRGEIGYIGPKPPAGQTHPYHFQVFALNGRVRLEPGADRNAVVAAMKGRAMPQVGRVEISIIEEDNPRLLAFVRGDGAQAVLVLANLSRKVETVRLRGLQVAGDELARGQVAGEQLPGKWMSVGSETGASIDILDEDSLRAELPASAIGWWTRVGQQNG